MPSSAPLRVLSLAAALYACGERAEPSLPAGEPTGEGARTARVASSVPLASAAVPAPVLARAEQALRDFLDASREGVADHQRVAQLTACGDPAGSWFPSTLLAAYTVLPSEMREDTIVGRASVVTVAEQDVDRGARDRFTARLRVRTDVLEWDLLADDAEQWMVCNGLRFGYRGADSLTTWRPDGASHAEARRLADSVWMSVARPPAP
jgi:hypothetical protein